MDSDSLESSEILVADVDALEAGRAGLDGGETGSGAEGRVGGDGGKDR